MVELIILKFSDASFPYLPSNFLTTLHFNNLSYPTLKTLDFNRHWKSICHESGRENLLEKIRSCWWLICHVGIKAFKNSLSAELSARHITQSVCSAYLRCQVSTVWSHCTAALACWHHWRPSLARVQWHNHICPTDELQRPYNCSAL